MSDSFRSSVERTTEVSYISLHYLKLLVVICTFGAVYSEVLIFIYFVMCLKSQQFVCVKFKKDVLLKSEKAITFFFSFAVE
jgi:hypothetical protein